MILTAHKVIDSQLVAHGSCDVFRRKPQQTSQLQNSVIKTKVIAHRKVNTEVGERAYSNWGINTKYWLNGLEKTNNNAKG